MQLPHARGMQFGLLIYPRGKPVPASGINRPTAPYLVLRRGHLVGPLHRLIQQLKVARPVKAVLIGLMVRALKLLAVGSDAGQRGRAGSDHGHPAALTGSARLPARATLAGTRGVRGGPADRRPATGGPRHAAPFLARTPGKTRFFQCRWHH